MKVKFRISAFFALMILAFSFHRSTPNEFPEECNVVEIYEAATADYGVKVLTTFGILEEADLILLPATIEEGSYKVNITRKATDLYILEGTDYCIKTNYCL